MRNEAQQHGDAAKRGRLGDADLLRGKNGVTN